MYPILAENDCSIQAFPFYFFWQSKTSIFWGSSPLSSWKFDYFFSVNVHFLTCVVAQLMNFSAISVWMLYCSVIKAGPGGFKYFCVWLTSPKTSHLIKDNSGKNRHIQQRATSERIPLWIPQFFKGWGSLSRSSALHTGLHAVQSFCPGKPFPCASFCSISHQWSQAEKNNSIFSKVPPKMSHMGERL